MIPSKCEQDLTLPCYFFDIRSRMRPAAFFDIAQNLAGDGAEMLGASDKDLLPRGLVWILARMHVHYDRIPERFESVRVQTWHSGVTGPLFTRDYMMLDASGKAIVRSTSSWALMDITNRVLAKCDRIFDLLSAEPQCAERALEANAAKIIWPRELVPEITASHMVCYSDVDYNGHANNARYPVWVYDALPKEYSEGRTLTDFSINYNRELHPGETASIRLARPDSDTWLAEGSHDGSQNFICKLNFRQE